MEHTEDGRTIAATETSLKIIEELRRQDGATLISLANGLNIAKSTAHGHLATLQKLGYVVHEQNEYHVALKFLHFGEYARNRDPRYDLAKQQVHELSDLTNEEADFTVEEHGRLISLYHSLGQSSESGMQVGSYFFMHTTASGKAILAEWPREKVDAVIDQWGLPQDTDYTITDRDELYTELERTRERGYGINDQEIIEGFRSIGTVVHAPDGSIFGSLSIGGPTYRVNSNSEIISKLQASTEQLEQNLELDTHESTDWWGQYFNSQI